ncbi:anhydro-N-acetylmuramic acid kinase [Halopolyspora algeriensis]|uniref:Anhydro-N-acetylmuramic acid kinase n=1 Tax=Halopolyspora algeriensis TaxID=1500506 RepID=A0A368VF83_9ACTN|nr:anhydro-N-acetylmuramic acid kinase [Halopolyspora algeriensis]RCW39859.1 anhydro-N-acetylmuramic acid kinase [Halopolyspora algeriensis]TQM56514.1 anhydro-N-acetylmuramic acid kinase [Halopolyspora algeriensis]
MCTECLHLPDRVSYTTPVTSWRVIGLLSGTSMDGVDVAAADFRYAAGTILLRPLGHTAIAYPNELREGLLAALPPGECSAGELCRLDTLIGQSFAEAARYGLDSLAGGHADLTASLGQTLYHWVDNGRSRGTLQLGQPAWIAESTGLPVIADLRARDVAAGGQGAPLAGMLDALWLATERARPDIALNIGGIANITVVGGEEILAYDTGPGNALIDAAATTVTGGARQQDTNGEIAARGTVRPDVLGTLLSDTYFGLRPPKSTGKEHFNGEYLRRVLAGTAGISDADLLATLTELTATTIADACRAHRARTVVASGGGVANPVLMAALRRLLDDSGIELTVSDALGLPSDSKEAYLTALLGFLGWNGMPGNVPSTTGARGPRILGSFTPGSGPLRPPPVPDQPARRLRVVTDEHTDARNEQEAPCGSPTSS